MDLSLAVLIVVATFLSAMILINIKPTFWAFAIIMAFVDWFWIGLQLGGAK